MATAEENKQRLQEIANRGLQDQLPPEKRAVFDEAAKRGIITVQAPVSPSQASIAQDIPQVQAPTQAPVEAPVAPQDPSLLQQVLQTGGAGVDRFQSEMTQRVLGLPQAAFHAAGELGIIPPSGAGQALGNIQQTGQAVQEQQLQRQQEFFPEAQEDVVGAAGFAGGIAPDIAAFGAAGTGLVPAGSVLSGTKVVQALESSPFLTNVMKNATIGGTEAATQFQEGEVDLEKRKEDALIGASLGGGITGVLTTVSKLKDILPKFRASTARKESVEALLTQTPEQAEELTKVLETFKRNGVFVTPGEISKLETLLASEASANLQEPAKLALQKIVNVRKQQVSDMTNEFVERLKLSPDEAENMKGLYTQLQDIPVDEGKMLGLLTDPVAKDVFDRASKNNSLARELGIADGMQGINNVAFLDNFKRVLDTDISKAQAGKETFLKNISERELIALRGRVVGLADEAAEIGTDANKAIYQEARQLGLRNRIVRNIEESLDKKPGTLFDDKVSGSDLYNSYLKSRANYNGLIRDLDFIKDPVLKKQAVQSVRDLRTILRTLATSSPVEKALKGDAETIAKRGGITPGLIFTMGNLQTGKYNRHLMEMITDPKKWEKELIALKEAAKKGDPVDRVQAASRIINRVATQSLLEKTGIPDTEENIARKLSGKE